MITINNLDKSFGKTNAVQNVSFTIPLGGILCLVGPNGSGKSTLLKLVLGLIKPDRGSISNHGKHPTFGYMPEIASIPGSMTPLRIVKSFKEILPGSEDCSDEVIELFAMQEYYRKPVKSFSKGMHKKLAFLLAVLNSPDILVLDEPFEGLDTIDRDKLNQFLLNYAASGKTVLLSTHILYELDSLVSQALFIKKGHLLFDFNIHEKSKSTLGPNLDTHLRDHLLAEQELLTITEIYRRLYQ